MPVVIGRTGVPFPLLPLHSSYGIPNGATGCSNDILDQISSADVVYALARRREQLAHPVLESAMAEATSSYSISEAPFWPERDHQPLHSPTSAKVPTVQRCDIKIAEDSGMVSRLHVQFPRNKKNSLVTFAQDRLTLLQ